MKVTRNKVLQFNPLSLTNGPTITWRKDNVRAIILTVDAFSSIRTTVC